MIVELIKVGDCVALPLPDDVLRRLGLEPGDKVALSVGKDGDVRLTNANTETSPSPVELARQAIDEYRETLTDLAK